MKRLVCNSVAIAAVAAAGFGVGNMTGARQLLKPVSVRAVSEESAPPAPRAEAAPISGGRLPSFASVVETAAPAVVHVKVVSAVKTSMGEGEFPFGEDGPFRGFRFPMPPPAGRQQGTGSGFIIRKDGIVLTNNHVVDDAKEITVRLNDSQEYQAKVLGRDPKTDLAVLKIDAKKDLPVVHLGNSDALRVGDWVVAIGNPFGLDSTVTAGIVSAKGRAIGSGPYDQYIQTDAPINPGNSGGPLFDESGNVIGINSAIFSRSGGNVGIGFAIPINLAKELVPQLEEDGHVTRGWLGVSIQPLTTALAESLGIEGNRGALVAGVTAESPAAKAGIKTGDVITAYDEHKIDEHNGLPGLVAATKVGETVPIEILRDGKHRTLDVTVARMADEAVQEATGPHRGKWGMALRDLTAQERAQRNLEAGEGVLIAQVEPGSPADDAGLHAGDIVLQVNRKPVGTADALRKEAGRVEGKNMLLLVHPAEGVDHFTALAAR